ncbi:nucleophosmin-like [Ascaphus truei]|uniref:nucleophosmin-like n=1 Tax=Ascaphus truei TaxID=8439 RepID=UPI003F59B888
MTEHQLDFKLPNLVLSIGCELNETNKSYVFENEDVFLEHLLVLWTLSIQYNYYITLTSGLYLSRFAVAKDEVNMVAVGQKHIQGKPVTIASLRPSILPMNGVESGSGPVYISGEHLTLKEDLEDTTQEEEHS